MQQPKPHEILADAMLFAMDALGYAEYKALQTRAIAASKANAKNWRHQGPGDHQVLTARGMAFVARYLRLSVEDPCPN